MTIEEGKQYLRERDIMPNRFRSKDYNAVLKDVVWLEDGHRFRIYYDISNGIETGVVYSDVSLHEVEMLLTLDGIRK